MNQLNISPLTEEYISPLADYWDDLSDEQLIAMGALREYIPPRATFVERISHQLSLPDEDKIAFAFIAFLDGVAIGHCNLNPIHFGQWGKMHLHLWQANQRQKGLGKSMVEQALPLFLERFKLEKIVCEPLAANVGPNRVLEKVGFKYMKKYTTIPSPHCFEQEVIRWEYPA